MTFISSLRRRVGASSIVVALCVLALVVLVARRAWIADDAFITLRTVDQFVHGRGLVWNTGFRVQVYTHPAWMFLLSAAYGLTHEPYFTTLALSTLVTAAAAVVLFRDVAKSNGARVVALVALSTSAAFLDFSTSGLENPLAHLLLLLAYRAHVRSDASPVRTSVPIGLLAVTRHDLTLLVLPIAVEILVSLRRSSRNERLRTLTALALPLIAWTAFSLVYYGVPFPNTAYAKLGGGLPRSAILENGIGYYQSTLLYDPMTLFTMAAGLVAGAVAKTRSARLVALGIGLYLVYVVWVGGDFMRGRFFTAPLILSVALIAERIPAGSYRWPALACVVWVGLFAFALENRPPNGPLSIDERGIADEREHWSVATGIENAFGPHALSTYVHVVEARANAERAHAGIQRVFGAHTAGFTGFFAGPEVHVVEWFGLTDPVLARMPAMREVRTRPGHLLRYVDDDYMAMIDDAVRGRPFVCRGEPVRCALLHDVLLTTTGPLFTSERFAAISRLVRGSPDWGESFEHYQRPYLVTVPLAAVAAPVAEGTPWDSPRAHRFRDAGIAITVPEGTHAETIRLTLDHNDAYRVHFQRQRMDLATLVLEPRPDGGLRRHERRVPAAARDGTDRILVEPIRGDGAYSLGDLVLRASP